MTTLNIPHPPTTPFICAVGVTGHRDLPSESIPAITTAVSDILAHIRYEVVRQMSGVPPSLFSHCVPILRCVSPLARGADQIVAKQALSLGYELQSPLPFFQEEYEQDFGDDASKQTFHSLLSNATVVLQLDGTRLEENEAYLTAGRIVLEQSDILIAVWDGKPANGIGGTGQIVAEAEERCIPTFIIDPANPTTIRYLSSCAAASWEKELAHQIKRLLNPQTVPATSGESQQSRIIRLWNWILGNEPSGTSAAVYFAETWPKKTILSRFPSWFEKLMDRETQKIGCAHEASKSLRERCVASWKRLRVLLGGSELPCPQPPQTFSCDWSKALDLVSQTDKDSEELLVRHYTWADELAIHYASQFRAVGFLRHLLMAAVMIGVFIGFYVEHFDALGFGIEVSAFAIILYLVRASKVYNWHQRFLDYRFMAEQLRHMRFLFMLGRVPAITHDSADPVCTSDSWLTWHLRNVVRQAGLVYAKMTPNLLESYRARLGSEVIQGQIDYYTTKQNFYHNIGEVLNTIGIRCFAVGLGLIVLRFLVFLWVKDKTPLPLGIEGGNLRTLINEIALVIPSVASMAFAIRAQGEYTTLSSRYAHTRMMLAHKKQQLSDTALLTSEKLANFSEKLAKVMAGEVVGWHALVKRKSLSPYS